LLGAHLIRQLIKEQYLVRVIVRKQSDLSSIIELPIEFYYGEITEENDVLEASKDCEAIIHVASSTNIAITDFSYHEKVNVLSTKHVLKAAQANRAKLILVSTANTFGAGTLQSPGDELSEFSLFKVGSGYVNSKYLAQQLVLEAVEKNQVNAVIVNPTFILGAYDIKPSSGVILLHALNSKRVLYTKGGKNFVYAGDVAKGICLALKKGKEGQCYILGGENHTFKDFFLLVDQIQKVKKRMIKIPSLLLWVGALIADGWIALTKKPQPFNSINVKILQLDNYYQCEKAKRELGYQPRSVIYAIQDTLNYFKEKGRIR
jgi:dihydroflavonol-4-reductase